MHVLVIGAGYMAEEYVKVLKGLHISFSVIGRNKKKAEDFQKKLSVEVFTGGLNNAFYKVKHPTHAIVATSLESLEENVLFLLGQNVKHILVEKPGAVTLEGFQKIMETAEKCQADVFIAYNRRFYASVLEARKRIEQDGGLTSFLFEFTEWSHMIERLKKTRFQFENWFYGNSTHVLDTAFFFGGFPQELQGFVQSNVEWHPKGGIFVGAGITENNIPFSYHANWKAPGSWKLELLTNKNRYIFRPFEELHAQKIGKMDIEKVNIDNQLDIEYKPGLYRQVEQFLFGKGYNHLLSIGEGKRMFEWYTRILEHG